MGIDLYSLRMNLETTGVNNAVSDLKAVDDAGRQTAQSLNTAGDGYLKAGRTLGGFGEVAAATAPKLDMAASAALNGTKGFRDLSGAYQHQAKVLAEMDAAQVVTTGGLSRLAIAGIAVGAGVLATGLLMQWGAGATDEFRLSQLRLEGVSKITGVPLENLQRVSANLQRDFKLTAVQANDLTAGMNKLTQAAKQPEKLEQSLRALMDLGAARGLSAAETKRAINSALAGLDEGTDKLFMKNPSEIYRKWATEAGTTVAAMTSLERAQALLDAVLEDGAKTRGSYEKFLETVPGKMAQLETNTNRLKIATGNWFEGFRAFLVGAGAGFIGWLAGAVEGLNKLGKADYSGLRAAMGLGPAMSNHGFGGATDWDAGGGPSRVGQKGRGQGIVALWSEAEVKLLADGFKLGTLTRQENERRLEIVRVLNAEMERGNLAERNHLKELINDLLPKAAKAPSASEKLRKMLALMPGGGFVSGAPDDLGNPNDAPIGLRGGGFGAEIMNLEAPLKRGTREIDENSPAYMRGASFMDQLRAGLVSGLARMRPFQDQIAGFFQNIFMTGKIGQSLKNFGKEILAGMGSIFAQMAAKAIVAAPLFQAIGAAMHNPFTAGFALLAFGLALSALGASMGGAAQGTGGGGDGGIRGRSEDTITQIHLTANGAGGFVAPTPKPNQHYTIIGVNDRQAQRAIMELQRNAMRNGER